MRPNRKPQKPEKPEKGWEKRKRNAGWLISLKKKRANTTRKKRRWDKIRSHQI